MERVLLSREGRRLAVSAPVDNEDVVDRIFKLMKEKGVNATEAAKGIGITRAAFTGWKSKERGKRIVSSALIPKIAEYFDVTTEYLLTGVRRIETSRKLFCVIKAYDWKIGAGSEIAPNGNEPESVETTICYPRAAIDRHHADPAKCFSLIVSGDSMAPTLADGDKVIICKDVEELKDGGVYAFRLDDQIRVKRLSRNDRGDLIIRSDNPDYEPVTISKEEAAVSFEMLGRAIEKYGSVT